MEPKSTFEWVRTAFAQKNDLLEAFGKLFVWFLQRCKLSVFFLQQCKLSVFFLQRINLLYIAYGVSLAVSMGQCYCARRHDRKAVSRGHLAVPVQGPKPARIHG